MCLQEMQFAKKKLFLLKLQLNLPPNNDGSHYRWPLISENF